MTDVVVIRGLGDRPGDDIVEPLLATTAAALSRGRAEMDSRSTAQSEKQVTIPYTAGLRNGMTVQISDILQGATYIGKITAIDHDVTPGKDVKAHTQLTLLVPSTFFD